MTTSQPTTQARWTLGGRAQQYRWSQCRYCGRAQDHDCAVVECMLCGSPQCFGNGSGNGLCSVCLHGYLPGWSRGYSTATQRVCTYKGCDHEAVGTARKRAVCLDHAAKIKVTGFGGSMPLTEYVAKSLELRDSGKGRQRWTLVQS